RAPPELPRRAVRMSGHARRGRRAGRADPPEPRRPADLPGLLRAVHRPGRRTPGRRNRCARPGLRRVRAPPAVPPVAAVRADRPERGGHVDGGAAPAGWAGRRGGRRRAGRAVDRGPAEPGRRLRGVPPGLAAGGRVIHQRAAGRAGRGRWGRSSSSGGRSAPSWARSPTWRWGPTPTCSAPGCGPARPGGAGTSRASLRRTAPTLDPPVELLDTTRRALDETARRVVERVRRGRARIPER